MYTPDDNKTEFNGNVATLQRIDYALRLARDCSFRKELVMWFDCLRTIKNEAMVKMKHKIVNGKCSNECIRCISQNKYEQLFRDITVYERGGIKYNSTMGMNLFNDLDNFELILRDFMDKKGMLLKDGENTSGL